MVPVDLFIPGCPPLNSLLEELAASHPEVPVYIHTGHHSHGAPSQLFLLAGRFPGMRFIMGHSGATDYATDVVPVCRQRPNVYVESSFARPPGFIGRLPSVGWDRGIMGSGWPLNGLEFEWSEMRRLLPAATVVAMVVLLAKPNGRNLLFALIAGAVQFLSFWSIVFTGRHPRALWGVLERYFRYSSLLQAWMMYLADAYPPFAGSAERAA